MNVAWQRSAYFRLMGREATDRQTALAAEHFPCCGAKRAKGLHEPHCRKGNRG